MILRRFAVWLLPALVAVGCAGSFDPNSIAGAIREEEQARRVRSVRPPPRPDLTRTGRVGLLLDTNAVGWRRALDTPGDAGAVILLVAPGSPAEKAGLLRGDVIVKVGPTRVRNDERASVALRGRPGVPLRVRVLRDGRPVDLSVVPATVADQDLVALYDQMLRRDPRDPTTLLLRAQASTAAPQQALSYVNRALEEEPELVDALVFRARLYWSEAQRVDSEAVILEDQRRAREDYDRALRIDPRSTSAFVGRGTALFENRGYADAERDALRAIAADASLPGAYLLLAMARVQLGRPGDAAAPAREAVRLSPYDAEAYRILALTFVALERTRDAERTVNVGLTVALDDNQRAALRAVVER